MHTISFGSDNHSGVHPDIIDSIVKANKDYAVGYGEDSLTEEVTLNLKELFGCKCDVWLVMTGTGANVLALQCLANSFNSIICSDISHINVDECGAVQKFTQARLETVTTGNGKLTPELIKPLLVGRGDEHRSQKKVVSISQTTEYGTLYTIDELNNLADFAHSNGLYLHVDGARLANAAVSLGVSMKDMIYRTGVDIVSFGGTKNGMMFGEAIISFNPKLTRNLMYFRKQAAQLFSKMRYISAQFQAYLNDDLWIKNAHHANKMAKLLVSEMKNIEGITITQNVESNAVFAVMPQAIIKPLQDTYHFYSWNEERNEVRLMCSFDTTEEHIHSLIGDIHKLLLETS